MDKKDLKFVAQTKADKKNRTLTVTISTKSPDRSRDIVEPQGMKSDNYLRNPVVAFGHDYRGLAIGKTISLEPSADRIVATVQFPDEGVYPFADQVYRLYKDGFMSAWSIGFMPMKAIDLDTGGRQFMEWELLEFSAVLVPDNPEALTMFRSKGLDFATIKDVQTVLENKNVIPYKDSGIAPVETEWDIVKEAEQAQERDIKEMAAWSNVETPDGKPAYKLAHHKAGEGHPAVLKGVVSAMGALLASGNGVGIPEADRKGVYDHLAKHYAQFDLEAPEFKEYKPEELAEIFKGYETLIKLHTDVVDDALDSQDGDAEKKEGRVLSSKTRKQIGTALEQITNLTNAFNTVATSLKELLEASDTPKDTETDKTVIDLAEGLKVADKAIGLVLRKLKEAKSLTQ